VIVTLIDQTQGETNSGGKL